MAQFCEQLRGALRRRAEGIRREEELLWVRVREVERREVDARMKEELLLRREREMLWREGEIGRRELI